MNNKQTYVLFRPGYFEKSPVGLWGILHWAEPHGDRRNDTQCLEMIGGFWNVGMVDIMHVLSENIWVKLGVFSSHKEHLSVSPTVGALWFQVEVCKHFFVFLLLFTQWKSRKSMRSNVVLDPTDFYCKGWRKKTSGNESQQLCRLLSAASQPKSCVWTHQKVTVNKHWMTPLLSRLRGIRSKLQRSSVHCVNIIVTVVQD